jgi:hypothetical protein
VLLTSGDRAIQAQHGLARGRSYIGKPYIYRDVERRLRQLIEGT